MSGRIPWVEMELYLIFENKKGGGKRHFYCRNREHNSGKSSKPEQSQTKPN